MRSVRSLKRLLPYVWFQRRSFIAIGLLSFVAAVLSVVSLSLVFPVVKLLVEGEGLRDHIVRQHENAIASVSKLESRLSEIDQNQQDSANQRQVTLRRLKTAKQNESHYSWLVKHAVPWIPSDRFELLSFVMGLLMVVTLIKCLASYWVDILVGSVNQKAMFLLRQRLFQHTLELDHQTLALETNPKLMSQFTFDLQQVSLGVALFGTTIILEPLRVVICIV
ncbi:MAG: hypothetical protein FJ267_16185, partial [Planctomycetes bacterium]|nr:hypothetical protein [Planctomycetota bacterium]